MTIEQEKELINIAEHLIGTLGDMPAKDADERVAQQVSRLYSLAGYEVQTFVVPLGTMLAKRKYKACTRRDMNGQIN